MSELRQPSGNGELVQTFLELREWMEELDLENEDPQSNDTQHQLPAPAGDDLLR